MLLLETQSEDLKVTLKPIIVHNKRKQLGNIDFNVRHLIDCCLRINNRPPQKQQKSDEVRHEGWRTHNNAMAIESLNHYTCCASFPHLNGKEEKEKNIKKRKRIFAERKFVVRIYVVGHFVMSKLSNSSQYVSTSSTNKNRKMFFSILMND
ncbi:CLUMA_CG013023, isoform A [Clunio marinus]|uniref:CLUMA_CG013023, isoform A n=1 Tax=Clunio marinus TaxID=568069 RepID=A0A1J1IHE9_9DIPT|nr:CLUMA_CG013023, isoform A [Clunio marinus]